MCECCAARHPTRECFGELISDLLREVEGADAGDGGLEEGSAPVR